LSELHFERNDLEAASQYLLRSKELGEHAGLTENRYRWHVAMAGIKVAQGDPDGALDLLDEAERLYVRSPDPYVRPIAAVKTRVWILQGRLADAQGWVHDRGLSADDELSYLSEFEHITLARVLLAQYRSTGVESAIRKAMALLERLRKAAESGGRVGSLIEVLLLQALADEAHGDIARALVPLGRALSLAEPEGYVRLFVDQGAGMRDLLRHAIAAGIGSSYARRLLSAFEKQPGLVSAPVRFAAAGLIEPLTLREVEVLRLIAAGMTNQEIADHLVISLPTVKRHIANTFGKLNVGHRTEAVARANDLALI
jgi:LuxR family transcriptional regulator, maltose regulon positive regulatory protein